MLPSVLLVPFGSFIHHQCNIQGIYSTTSTSWCNYASKIAPLKIANAMHTTKLLLLSRDDCCHRRLSWTGYCLSSCQQRFLSSASNLFNNSQHPQKHNILKRITHCSCVLSDKPSYEQYTTCLHTPRIRFWRECAQPINFINPRTVPLRSGIKPAFSQSNSSNNANFTSQRSYPE